MEKNSKILTVVFVTTLLLPFIVWPGSNSRDPKEIFCLASAVTIALMALYNGSLKRLNNPWIFITFGMMVLSLIVSPRMVDFTLAYFRTKEAFTFYQREFWSVWMFKPVAYYAIFLIVTIFIASHSWTQKQLSLLLNLMFCAGVIMSIYLYIQYFGFDQLFTIVSEKENVDIFNVTRPRMVAFLGNSTIVSPFIAMLIPIGFYLRRFVWSGVMILVVVLCQSKVAIIAMIISILIYLCVKIKYLAPILLIVLIVSGVFVGKEFMKHKEYYKEYYTEQIWSESNGRLGAWKLLLEDWYNPIQVNSERKYTLTGSGPGSYHYIFTNRHKTKFFQAHNEYLEILSNCGLFALFSFLASIWYMLARIIKNWRLQGSNKPIITALVSSFACIAICAAGTFPWQIYPILFYTILIVGLLHNKEIVWETNNGHSI